MKIKSIFFIAASLFLTACATAPEQATRYSETDIGLPDSKQSVFVIYRQLVPPVAYSVKASVNGQPVATLPNNAFTWFYLEEGSHDIAISWPMLALMPGERHEVDVKSGNYYFLEFSGEMMVAGGLTLTPYSVSDLSVVNKDDAVQVLKNCCQFVPSSR